MSTLPPFRDALFHRLAASRWMTEAEAGELADQTATAFVTHEEVGGPHAGITDVILQWRALCRQTAERGRFLPGGGFEGTVVLTTLHWIHAARGHLVSPALGRSTDDAVEVDAVDAATCMALAKVGKTPAQSTEEWLGALLDEVTEILDRNTLPAVDRSRLRRAMDRLRALHAVVPRGGGHGLPEVLRFQIVDD
ncbi:MAG: hypothetical protein AAGE94_22865 [Acidobacteriota bacterium]